MEVVSKQNVHAAEHISSNKGYEFVTVANHDSYYKPVKKAFKDIVEKLYGDQTSAIQKIKRSEDRKCLVLVENGSPVAILVYKTEPTSEFSEYNIRNSLEVKTFMLINSDSKDIERHFSALYSKVVEIAKRLHASAIHVTVSEKVTWTMLFLKKMGFTIRHYWKDKYVPGLNEYMFCTDVGKFALQKLPAATGSDTNRQREAIRSPEMSSRWNNEVAKKRKHEDDDEREFDPKRRNVSNYDRQHSSNYHSQQDSYRRREKREETGYGRSDQEFRLSQGYNYNKNQGDKEIKKCTLMKKYIHMIQEGKKTVEGRINSGMFTSFRKGDTVKFFNQQDYVICEIEDVVEYDNFEKMLIGEGVDRCIPGIHSVHDGVRAYHQIPGYEERARINGVLAFRLKVLRSGSSAGWRR